LRARARGLLVALELAEVSFDPYTLVRWVSVVFAAASIPLLWLVLTGRFKASLWRTPKRTRIRIRLRVLTVCE
jgi:hypothetical protein